MSRVKRLWKAGIILSALMVMSVSVGYAQKIIRGTLTDPTGMTIPGAAVTIDGQPGVGVMTDIDGSYEIEVPEGYDVLVFSAAGYPKKKETIGNRTTIDVKFETEVLVDVVKIAYMTARPRELSEGASFLDPDELAKSNSSTVEGAMAGRVPGMMVSVGSGKPGSGAAIRLRGVGSLNRDPQPLIVVDGVPGVSLDMINSDDIESVSVLKDAAATASYGNRGANGVILIQTKKGSTSDAPRISFSTYRGITKMPKKLELMNSDQYVQMMSAAFDNYPEKDMHAAYTDSARERHGWTSTDWIDEMTQQGLRENYSLMVNGGNERASYSFSGNYYNETGVVIKTRLERYTLRMASEYNILESGRVRFGESLIVSRENVHGNSGDFLNASIASPLMPVYEDQNLGGYAGPTDTITGGNDKTNVIAEQALKTNDDHTTRILANFHLDADLIKIGDANKGETSHALTYSFQLGAKYTSDFDYEHIPEYELGNKGNRSNTLSSVEQSAQNNRRFMIDNKLTYTTSFKKHDLTVFVGHSTEQGLNQDFNATGTDVPEEYPFLTRAETLNSMGGSRNYSERIASIIGRVMYDYNDKYLFGASYRYDGSSNFDRGNKFDSFYSGSMGWLIDQEKFMDGFKELNLLKLRASYGITGNANIGQFQYLELMDRATNSWYVFGVDQLSYNGGMIMTSHASPDVKWEAVKQTNFGVDFAAYNNAIEVTADYYIKNQDDMLIRRQLSNVFGKQKGDADPFFNLGEMKNSGFELSVTYRNQKEIEKLDKKKLNYSLTGSFSTVRNEVLSIPTPIYRDAGTKTMVGRTVGSFYGWVADGIFQSWEEVHNHALQEEGTSPGDIRFKDLNGDGKITEADRTIIGKAYPDMMFSLNFEIDFAGFDLVAYGYGMYGLDVYNQWRTEIDVATDTRAQDNNKLVNCLNYWSPSNPTNDMTRAYPSDPNDNGRISSWFIEDASFFRIKTLQLGYTVPNKLTEKVAIQRLRVYAMVDNIAVLTNYSGYDPEVAPKDSRTAGGYDPLQMGIDNAKYPPVKSYMIGLQLNF